MSQRFLSSIVRLQNIVKFILRNIERYVNTIYEYIYCKKNSVTINSWINYRFGKLTHRNLGDDINVFLTEALTQKKCRNIGDIISFNRRSYMIIGSIIHELSKKNTIIWGAGVSHTHQELKIKPIKVCAVRGKLTRDYLISQQIECPEVYGDPALLLPFVYSAKKYHQHYKLGIILHKNDIGNKTLNSLYSRYNNDVVIIRFDNYDNLEETIDKVCSCDLVLSSSLHGLIISDAYKIPNIWVKSSVEMYGGDFKFLDYFSGIGRTTTLAIEINPDDTLEMILNLKDIYSAIDFEPSKLIAACPFPLSKDLKF